MRHADELKFASERFTTIELNGSFYSLQRPSSYLRWYSETPADFLFSVKGGRFITHMKRLKGAESALANFFASGLLRLGEKLGPILWQLPPALSFDAGRLRDFFELLPRTTLEAARTAAAHEPWLEGRVSVEAIHVAPLRHTLEVRHESFLSDASLALLEEYSVAACIADSAGRFPQLDAVTADFVYVRLHGAKQLYTSGYSAKELRVWAERIQGWLASARDVYVYFDNDVKVRAPFDAANLERILQGSAPRAIPRSLSTVQEEPRTTWEAWRNRREA
ncbi:MAG TPA: DUF72 domain-containing protein [Polyangiaceae bacterium]|nr:DUF72 domain-containing protein [Polyangiaceae bacterium]